MLSGVRVWPMQCLLEGFGRDMRDMAHSYVV